MPRLVALLAVAFALPLAAQTSVGVHVAASRLGSTIVNGTTIEFDRGRGAGVSVTFGSDVTLELAATSLRYDGALRLDNVSASTGTLRLRPITATAQWHFGYLYLGGGAAYVKASRLSSADLDALGIGSIDVESKRCWLANAGIAVPMRNAAIVVDAKLLDYRPNSGPDPVRLDLRPVIVSAGIRWRR